MERILHNGSCERKSIFEICGAAFAKQNLCIYRTCIIKKESVIEKHFDERVKSCRESPREKNGKETEDSASAGSE